MTKPHWLFQVGPIIGLQLLVDPTPRIMYFGSMEATQVKVSNKLQNWAHL